MSIRNMIQITRIFRVVFVRCRVRFYRPASLPSRPRPNNGRRGRTLMRIFDPLGISAVNMRARPIATLDTYYLWTIRSPRGLDLRRGIFYICIFRSYNIGRSQRNWLEGISRINSLRQMRSRQKCLIIRRISRLRIENVTLNSHLALFVAKHRHVFQMLSSYNMAMGRFLDVVWCDLSAICTMGRVHT